MAFFLLSQCWRSYQQAGALRRIEELPRRSGFKCPVCQASPPIGEYWLCPACKVAFDPFASAAVCPRCQAELALTVCVDCHNARPHRSWDAFILEV